MLYVFNGCHVGRALYETKSREMDHRHSVVNNTVTVVK